MEKGRKGTLKHSAENDLIWPLPPVSWIEPVLELNLETPEHLFFDAFNVSELAPTSQVSVFGRTLNLYDELFHQPQLVRVFLSQMLFANIGSLFLPVLGAETHNSAVLLNTVSFELGFERLFDVSSFAETRLNRCRAEFLKSLWSKAESLRLLILSV